MANKYMKKMFSILNHQVNANKDYIETQCHPNQNGFHKKKHILQMLVWMHGKKKPYTLLVGL
jgi:hypothetical protein